jgi:hypothetical protein
LLYIGTPVLFKLVTMRLENTFPRGSNGIDSEEDEPRLFRLKWDFFVGALLARGRRALINFGTASLGWRYFRGTTR